MSMFSYVWLIRFYRPCLKELNNKQSKQTNKKASSLKKNKQKQNKTLHYSLGFAELHLNKQQNIWNDGLPTDEIKVEMPAHV